MTSYATFFDDVLHGLSAPLTTANLDALAVVSIIEGKNDRFNPLNSVVPYGNSTPFNSVGVQDYHTFSNGVNGTVLLLKGSPWTATRYAMVHNLGTHAVLVAFANEYATWGSHPNFFGISMTSATELLNSQMPGTTSPPPPPHGERTYVVEPGDTLWGIAVKFYGSGTQWTRIYTANKAVIGRYPDDIKPGEKLVIP